MQALGSHLALLAWQEIFVEEAASTAPGAEAQPPSRKDLLEQASRCRRILKESLVDFDLPTCVDRSHGGYFESLREDHFATTGEKFLVLSA